MAKEIIQKAVCQQKLNGLCGYDRSHRPRQDYTDRSAPAGQGKRPHRDQVRLGLLADGGEHVLNPLSRSWQSHSGRIVFARHFWSSGSGGESWCSAASCPLIDVGERTSSLAPRLAV